MNNKVQAPEWGLLPAQVVSKIRSREWDNSAALKARLTGNKPFPIRVGLKPPTGRAPINHMPHFQKFIEEWRGFPQQEFVIWETVNYRDLSEQHIPKFLQLNNVQDLIALLGPQAATRHQTWKQNMSPVLQLNEALYPALIKHLETIEIFTCNEVDLLAKLIPQLSPGMGQGCYLRALPLAGVDTKFVENHEQLIADLLDLLHGNDISTSGNLHTLLGCQPNPKGWLTIRPLCASTINAMGGFPLLQTTGDLLMQHALPAANILVIENMQSGLGLSEMANTVAVIGGGKNVGWMQADWLKSRNCAYWGDIDTWGLSILSDARAKLKQVKPLMMDLKTLKLHEDRMVAERKSVENCPHHLTEIESRLFRDLKSGVFKAARLEQERLSADYIRDILETWLCET